MFLMPGFNASLREMESKELLIPVEIIERIAGELLLRPMAVAVDAKTIAIADAGNGRILVLDKKNKHIINEYNHTAGVLYPTGLAFDGMGTLWVADLYAGSVKGYTPRGMEKVHIDADHLGVEAFAPATVGIGAKGNLLVSDLANQQIWIFDREGQVQGRFGEMGVEPGKLAYVNGLLWSPRDNELILADTNNKRLQVFSMQGTFNRVLDEQFEHPRGLAWSSGGKHFYILDTHNHTINIYKKDQRIGTVGSLGQEWGQLRFPTHAVADGKGSLYVVDKENNRIVIYREHRTLR